MPAIDLSILNQRQTPAFYADTLANRPSAGFIGRIFVSTDTFAFYRDNGTTWDLIGGPGTGTVTGSGANGQVTYWNSASSITGSNNLFFDAVNGHLGVGTITPGTALDVKHDQSTVLQLEQETATNDTRIAFINSGVGLWRLGAFYNAGANDFGIFDIVGSAQRITVKKTTGQTFIGAETTSSGLFVVNSAISDNHIVILGANAPSIRGRTSGTAATYQFGLGMATTANNFIQGTTVGEFCIFNDSPTEKPILFGIKNATSGNTEEAARISAQRNLIVGKTTDTGQRLQISGTALISGQTTISNSLTVNLGGIFEIPVQSPALGTVALIARTFNGGNDVFQWFDGATQLGVIKNSGNFLIGTTTDNGAKLQVNGSITINNAVTASVLNTVTNKVSIVIGGVQYYLLASTSAV